MKIEIIGLIAATLTTGCSVPQIIHLLHTKNVSAISLPCYLMMWAGIILWLVYAIVLSDLPMIVGNIFSLCGVSFIIYCKLRYGEARRNLLMRKEA